MGRHAVPAALAASIALAALPSVAASTGLADAQGQATALHGSVVKFSRNGYEPDGDPVDRVIIAAVLHDKSLTLPDMTLVLSTYLENFQTATVPILPDLLRKDVTATSLGGFMQGKAALVDGAGHVRYQGGLLAEVFLDNDVHMVVDLDPRGMPGNVPSLRLSGAFTLHKDLTLAGALRTSRTLSRAETASLRVAHARPVSWQSIVGGMHVRYPAMMGTTSNGLTPIPFIPSPTPAGARTAPQPTFPATARARSGSIGSSTPSSPTPAAVRDVAATDARQPQGDPAPVWPFALGGVALVAVALAAAFTMRRTRPHGGR